MDFEDFFEQKNQPHRKHTVRNYNQNDGYHQSYTSGKGNFNATALVNSLKNSKKLRLALLVALLIIIALIIGLIVIFYPLITSIIGYISQNGVSGLVDEVINLLNKLWNGTK